MAERVFEEVLKHLTEPEVGRWDASVWRAHVQHARAHIEQAIKQRQQAKGESQEIREELDELRQAAGAVVDHFRFGEVVDVDPKGWAYVRDQDGVLKHLEPPPALANALDGLLKLTEGS